MSVYVYFSDEQKRRANEVDLIDFLTKQGETLIASGREKRLASNKSITVRGNSWYDHAEEKGGKPIEFVKMFYNVPYPEAMTMLLYGEQGQGYSRANKQVSEPPQRKLFKLPTKNNEMRRMFAYLVKTRKLDFEVVKYFVKEKLLYESKEWNKTANKCFRNVVFVGNDENGKAAHAHVHGLHTIGHVYKGNVEGGNPSCSFHHVGTSDKLFVFEAPIDMLSYISMNPENWQEHSYVSLCGVSSYAMNHLLEHNENIRKVCFCLDNDEAGHKASDRLSKLVSDKGYATERLLTVHKDWNEELCADIAVREEMPMVQTCHEQPIEQSQQSTVGMQMM